jgi:hypothetical protein
MRQEPHITPGPTVPPRPDRDHLPSRHPPATPSTPQTPTRRRYPVWVVASAVLTLVLMGAAALVQVAVHPHRADHASEFRLLARDLGGGPIRWNPCEPIHYVVNLGRAPAGSLEDVQESVRRVSAATSISFTYDGTTDEQPTRRRAAYQPGRYGDRWAPVLIAWVDPTASTIPFSSEGHLAAGVASPQVPDDGEEIIVSGWIAINGDDPNAPGFATIDAQGPVVLHELGHVMGLGHVREIGELMEPSGGGVTDFGPGDLEGLHRLGRSSGCLTSPDPSP